jgi:hypothetical protein
MFACGNVYRLTHDLNAWKTGVWRPRSSKNSSLATPMLRNSSKLRIGRRAGRNESVARW